MKLGDLYVRLGDMLASPEKRNDVPPDTEVVVIDTRSGAVDYLSGAVVDPLYPGDTEYSVELPVGTQVVKLFIG